jgi:peptidylamidoglycolate lyase
VTDVGQHQIFKFSYTGELLMKLGEANVPGNDTTHFNLPTDIAVAADGSFYVSDGYGNSRVIKFSAQGNYIFEWGEKGSQPGQFDLPHGIALDTKGNVFVADRENNRIQVFTEGGKFLEERSSQRFGKIYSLAFDKSNGQLIAVDHMLDDKGGPLGSDIIVFDAANKQSTQFGRTSSPVCEYHGVVIDDEGSIYVGDIIGNTIYKFRKIK